MRSISGITAMNSPTLAPWIQISGPGSRGALGVLDAGGDEDDVGAVGEMRRERFGQRERSEVVCCERHIPAHRVLRRAHREDARVVEQASDRKIKRDDLSGCTPYARNIRQVADH